MTISGYILLAVTAVWSVAALTNYILDRRLKRLQAQIALIQQMQIRVENCDDLSIRAFEQGKKIHIPNLSCSN